MIRKLKEEKSNSRNLFVESYLSVDVLGLTETNINGQGIYECGGGREGSVWKGKFRV